MSELIDQLRHHIRAVIVDPDAMPAYTRDQCILAPAGTPVAVVRAGSVAEVESTIRLAFEHRVPVVTRGAGTGLAGAANALDGGIVLDVSTMNQILDLDPVARTATVQPGVINAQLDTAARKHGLWYVPDPGSRDISSIGGNIATNAGGMCCAKYGVTADHVLTLTAVLGSGEVVHTGALTRKNVAGLDLTKLLIGSEGTLGVIIEATVKLLARPSNTATMVATFPSVRSAIMTVLALSGPENGIEAAAIELMDRTTVQAVNAMTKMGLDEECGAILLAQFDGRESAEQASTAAQVAQANGAEVFYTDDPDEGAALMDARRAALPALERLGTTLLDDVAVPVPRLPELLKRIDEISARHGVTIGTFGHAADGNLHPTIVFDANDEQARDRAQQAFDQIVSAAVELGGTISGEHGIGALKIRYLSQQVGSVERALMSRIKDAFDPRHILNPTRAY
jgi:glycolate oxidase